MTKRNSYNKHDEDDALDRALMRAPTPKVPDGLTARIIAESIRHPQQEPEYANTPLEEVGELPSTRPYMYRSAAAIGAFIVLATGAIATISFLGSGAEDTEESLVAGLIVEAREPISDISDPAPASELAANDKPDVMDEVTEAPPLVAVRAIQKTPQPQHEITTSIQRQREDEVPESDNFEEVEVLASNNSGLQTAVGVGEPKDDQGERPSGSSVGPTAEQHMSTPVYGPPSPSSALGITGGLGPVPSQPTGSSNGGMGHRLPPPPR